jgi:hypothetical protein
LFSQQAELFKTPPSNFNLPVVLSEADGSGKNAGLGNAEVKWEQSASVSAEELLRAFSSGSDAGILQIVKNVLMNANIPEEKINRIKITFTSSGVEEQSVDKEAIYFKDDFTQIYESDKVDLITKLFRTKSVKMELTYEGADSFDKEVSDVLSNGLRFGNKTESSIGNKMTIEVPNLTYGYEKTQITINRVADVRKTVILGVLTDVGLNSISTLKVLEGNPNDFFIRIGSSLAPEPVEFNVNSEKRIANFRLSSGEMYSLTFYEKSGNKVTFSLTGFKINFE